MSAINHPVAPSLNTKLDPIDKFVSEGLQKRCRQVFCPHVAWVTSADKIKVLQRLFGNVSAGERDTTIRYPYMLLTLASVQLASDRLNTKYASMRGAPAVISTDGVRSYSVSYLPVDMTVTAEFVAVEMADVLSYTSRWMFAYRKNLLAFNIDYGRASFSVTTSMSDNVSIPLRATGESGANEYIVTCDMTVHGFVSEAVLMDAQVALDVVIDSRVELAPEAGVVWQFRSQDAPKPTIPASSNSR